MTENLSRLEKLIGEDAIAKIKSSRVAVFGVGGVGGHAFEAILRSGVGEIDVIDGDVVAESNLNRQIISTKDNIGRLKVDVAQERAESINPEVIIHKHPIFYLPARRAEFNLEFDKWDFIVDAIDTVAAKLDIITLAKEKGIPIISAMGCGNRMDPTKLMVTDIYKTFNDPLAKVMRKELKLRGIKKLDVVCSMEEPLKPIETVDENNAPGKRSTPGSNAFVPGAAGLIMASWVINRLIY